MAPPPILLSSDRHVPEEKVAPIILDVEEQRENNPQVHKADEQHNLDIGETYLD